MRAQVCANNTCTLPLHDNDHVDPEMLPDDDHMVTVLLRHHNHMATGLTPLFLSSFNSQDHSMHTGMRENPGVQQERMCTVHR